MGRCGVCVPKLNLMPLKPSEDRKRQQKRVTGVIAIRQWPAYKSASIIISGGLNLLQS